MNRSLFLLCGALLWLGTSSASASVKLCIQTETSYSDNGFGEDWWQTDAPRMLRGAKVTVEKGGVTLLDDVFLGDGLGSGDPGVGCTPTMSPSSDNGSYLITVTTDARVNNNNVRLYKFPSTTSMYSVITTYDNTGGAGTRNVTVNGSTSTEHFRAFNAFSAALYSVYRHNGGLSNQNFDVQYDDSGVCVGGTNAGSVCTSDSQCTGGGDCTINTNQNRDGKIIINVNGQDNKFMVAHEVAHRLGRLAANLTGAGSYDPSIAACPSEPSGESHSMRSMELQEAAVHEGFAHFFAVDVWNDHAQDSCSFRYYKNIAGALRTVDCDVASSNAPLAYMESASCGTSEAMEGMGVELDWMRTFWDLHKSSGGAEFVDVIAWLRDSPDWNADGKEKCAYDFLNFGSIGRSFGQTWRNAAVANGIDHGVTPCPDFSCACFILL